MMPMSSSLQGGPIDMTSFGAILSGIGLLYWALVLIMLALALWKPKTIPRKILSTTLVLGLMAYKPARYFWEEHRSIQDYQNRLASAQLRFDALCQGAGEKINRFVDDVDGVVWMRWRLSSTVSGQYDMDDPYGYDCIGEDCLRDLLRVTRGFKLNPRDARNHVDGYQFVESLNPSDHQRYRYIGTMKLTEAWSPQAAEKYRSEHGDEPSSLYVFLSDREPIGKFSARYGVIWEDISTKEDRANWIAGSSLKIIDLATQEVLAERIGYMMDKGLGDRSGGRSPWFFAVQNACPRFSINGRAGSYVRTRHETKDFVIKVLRPKKGD